VRDALFYLLCALIFTGLLAADIITGHADLTGPRSLIYIGVLTIMYIAAIVAWVRVVMFKRVQKKMSKKYGVWRNDDDQ
jgi:hypothetical protein